MNSGQSLEVIMIQFFIMAIGAIFIQQAVQSVKAIVRSVANKKAWPLVSAVFAICFVAGYEFDPLGQIMKAHHNIGIDAPIGNVISIPLIGLTFGGFLAAMAIAGGTSGIYNMWKSWWDMKEKLSKAGSSG
jgi:hypothetical protein